MLAGRALGGDFPAIGRPLVADRYHGEGYYCCRFRDLDADRRYRERGWFELRGFVLGPALVGVLDPRTDDTPASYVVWSHLPVTADRDLTRTAPDG